MFTLLLRSDIYEVKHERAMYLTPISNIWWLSVSKALYMSIMTSWQQIIIIIKGRSDDIKYV